MISVWRMKKLAGLLGLPVTDVKEAIAEKNRFCRKFCLHDPRPKGKDRIVLVVHGKLRRVQDRLYNRVLLRYLRPSDYSFGGVKGRSIKDNAGKHLANQFLFTTDISQFYPTISHHKVFRFFRKSLGWPDEGSSICTQICTYDGHLALGLVTSPMLADQILRPLDSQIAEACGRYGVTYTRYVDDITLSAGFRIKDSPLPDIVRRLLAEHGFKAKTEKTLEGEATGADMAVTKLRLKGDHLDVRKEYIAALEDQIQAARDLAAGRVPKTPFWPEATVYGRVRFVLWVNPGRRDLLARVRSVDWVKAQAAAIEMNILTPVVRMEPLESAAASLGEATQLQALVTSLQ